MSSIRLQLFPQVNFARHQLSQWVSVGARFSCNRLPLRSVKDLCSCQVARSTRSNFNFQFVATRGFSDRVLRQGNQNVASVLSKQCWTFQQNQSVFFSTKPNSKRASQLMIATYVSCVIGGLLLTAIAYRFYGRFKRRARGIESVDVPLFGRRNKLFCRYRGYILPNDIIDSIVNEIPWFEVRADDIWVVSFPKAGTTWLQEIVYLVCNDFDYDKARAATIEDRFPFLELGYPGLKVLAQTPSPRFIKTHLPFSLLPKQLDEKKPKVLYIARNSKDTAVSYQSFTKMLNLVNFYGTEDDFAQLFAEGTVFFGPWEKHVKEAWERSDEENFLFVTYEDLHKDFKGTVKDIARFLDKPMSEQQLAELEHHCSFSSMQNNDSVNYSWQKGLLFKDGEFLRKGKVGDWKNHLSPEMSEKLDSLMSSLEPLGLHFVDS